MGAWSIWHWLILSWPWRCCLFGGSGKISAIMGDVAKGIKSFKKGMTEDEETAKRRSAKKDGRQGDRARLAHAIEPSPAERGKAG